MSGFGHEKDGKTRSNCQEFTECRDFGLHKRYLFRQDGYIDNEPDVGLSSTCGMIRPVEYDSLITPSSQFLTIENGSTPLREYRVTGSTFAPVGEISASDARFSEKGIARTRPVERLMEISAICNDARIAYNDVSRFVNLYPGIISPVCLIGNPNLYQPGRTDGSCFEGSRRKGRNQRRKLQQDAWKYASFSSSQCSKLLLRTTNPSTAYF